MKKILAIIAVLVLFPALTFAQDVPKKTAYFFYLDTCPHCHNVNDYFNANGIYDKYNIVKLDASVPQNGQFLMALYGANNYPESQRGGVPVVAFGDKFYVGDQPIIDNFVKEIDASQNADQLPNPNKDGSAPDVVVHEGPIGAAVPAEAAVAGNNADSAGSGNKKSYVPVIVGVLVILGAGALIYVNRK